MKGEEKMKHIVNALLSPELLEANLRLFDGESSETTAQLQPDRR